ncbi:hypothetical protein ABQJ54_18065 [Rhodanobacter sp. Si-c]|uniref:Uncharacterized protein n=1 Tax=Rhodanobacter lycopersici TaxID=3162487 RepID=A0ABV3QIJ0_9GAMM
MAYCWQLKDIPELRDVRDPRGRRLWREAVTRSTTPRHMLGPMALVFVAVLLLDSVRALLLPTIPSLWVAVVAVVGFVSDAWIRQPATRRWLREHAHELDRYMPA